MRRLLLYTILVASGATLDDKEACDVASAPVVSVGPEVAAPSALPRFEGVIKVIVKAPIHNPCQSKKYPALKKFWQEVAPKYRASVDLKAFIQAPEFLFYGADFAFLGSHTMGVADTTERYEELLQINGMKYG